MENLDNIIYEQRLLVFIESEPQSNKYHQVLLEPEQFKRVSNAVSYGKITGLSPNGNERVEFLESDEVYTLPDLKSIYIENK